MSADAIEKARATLQARKREISHELGQIERALASLKGSRRSSRSRQQRRSATRRGRRGGRSEQFLAAVKKNPGTPVGELAKKIGISAQQGHGIARRLRERGEIKKQGQGYAVKA